MDASHEVRVKWGGGYETWCQFWPSTAGAIGLPVIVAHGGPGSTHNYLRELRHLREADASSSCTTSSATATRPISASGTAMPASGGRTSRWPARVTRPTWRQPEITLAAFTDFLARHDPGGAA